MPRRVAAFASCLIQPSGLSCGCDRTTPENGSSAQQLWCSKPLERTLSQNTDQLQARAPLGRLRVSSLNSKPGVPSSKGCHGIMSRTDGVPPRLPREMEGLNPSESVNFAPRPSSRCSGKPDHIRDDLRNCLEARRRKINPSGLGFSGLVGKWSSASCADNTFFIRATKKDLESMIRDTQGGSHKTWEWAWSVLGPDRLGCERASEGSAPDRRVGW